MARPGLPPAFVGVGAGSQLHGAAPLGFARGSSLVERTPLGVQKLAEPEECAIWVGADVIVLESDPHSPSIDEFIRVSQFDYWDTEALARLLRARDLMPAWRAILEDKLERARMAAGWLGLRPLRISHRKACAGDAVELELRCPEGRPLAPFEPGQLLMLAFPSAVGAPRLRRAYPLLGEPGDPYCYRIRVEQGSLGEASPVLDALVEGYVLRAEAPRGGRLR